jgi:thiamine-phosphate pyrophosphorylase
MAESDRLYLITPPVLAPDFVDALAAALDAGGVACVRLALAGDADAIRQAAAALSPVCARRETPLVIAEHVNLVKPLGLQGVHLGGATPAAVRNARAALGRDAIVGAGAGTTRHRGMTLAEAGADYVAFGPVHADGLGDGSEATAELFAWWDQLIETPSVAEGGLTTADAALRADFLAPLEDIWSAPDGPAAAIARWRAALAEAGS